MEKRYKARSIKSRRALSLWIVPHGEGKVRKVKFSYLTLFSIMVLCGLGLCSVLLLAGDYSRVQWQRFNNYLLMRQLKNERDSLVKHQDNLNSEIQRLKTLQEQSLAYEQDVRQKLSEIEGILEQATTLEVLEESENGSEAPLEEGVGGAEVECGIDSSSSKICSALAFSGAASRDLVYRDLDPRAQLNIATMTASKINRFIDSSAPPAEGLISLIDRYVDFVRAVPLAKPTKGGRLSSGFGVRYSPFTKRLSLHEGIDISLSTGSAIFSTAEGVVKKVERNRTYGLMVDVEHNDKLTTRYAHLSQILVKKNQKIDVGTVLGLAGSTGRSTGPHLHYEILVAGRAKNPKRFLDLAHGIRKML